MRIEIDPLKAETWWKKSKAYRVLSDKQKRFDYDNSKGLARYLIKEEHDIYAKYSAYSSNYGKREIK